MVARARRERTAAGPAWPAETRGLGRDLRRLARAARLLEFELLEGSGITRAQGHVLLAVGRMGRPSMAMLARELELAPSTLTRLVDPLVRQGLLSRDLSADDRRVIVIVPTATGRRLCRRVGRSLDDAYGRVVGRIPRPEQPRVLRAIQALLRAIDGARLGSD